LRHSTLFSCILAVLNSPTIFLRKGFSFFQQALIIYSTGVFKPTSPTMGKVADHPAMLPSLAMMPFLGVALVALFFRSQKKGRSPLTSDRQN